MAISIFGIFIGVTLMILGAIGKPSDLDEPINTATLVFLFGVLFIVIALN